MARGFNVTVGTATTDRIASVLTSQSTLRTWSIWANRRADANAEYWNKSNAATEALSASIVSGVVFKRGLSVSGSEWRYTPPATGVWTNILVTYDAGNPATAPFVYFNGIAQTVQSTVVGSVSANTDANPMIVGNRAAADRAFDGSLAEFAVWDRILAAAEIAAVGSQNSLYGGRSALLFPTGLVEYIRMDDNPVTSWVTTAPTVTGALQTTHPTIDYGYGGVSYHRSSGYPRNSMNPILTTGRTL